MESHKTSDPEPATWGAEGGDLIGVAIIVVPPIECTPLSTRFFRATLEAGLRLNGIEPAGNAALFGRYFMVWTMVAPYERNASLRAIQEVITALGYWDVCELAFFDRSEGYWRTIHHPCPHLYEWPSFARFLTEERMEESMELVRKEQSALEGWSVLHRLIEEGEAQI